MRKRKMQTVDLPVAVRILLISEFLLWRRIIREPAITLSHHRPPVQVLMCIGHTCLTPYRCSSVDILISLYSDNEHTWDELKTSSWFYFLFLELICVFFTCSSISQFVATHAIIKYISGYHQWIPSGGSNVASVQVNCMQLWKGDVSRPSILTMNIDRSRIDIFANLYDPTLLQPCPQDILLGAYSKPQ